MTAWTERAVALPGTPASEPVRQTRHQRHHSAAFWIVAAAFCANLAFSAVPTPLYVIYQRRDHFSTVMITVVYAVYALGVIASLFLGGHVSDWVGRRRVLVPALAVNVLSAVLFIAVPSLPGLIIARIVSGVSIGLTTGPRPRTWPNCTWARAGRRRAGVRKWWPQRPTSAGSGSGRLAPGCSRSSCRCRW